MEENVTVRGNDPNYDVVAMSFSILPFPKAKPLDPIKSIIYPCRSVYSLPYLTVVSMFFSIPSFH